MTVKLNRPFEIRLIDQIELAQAEHQPPTGEGNGKENPQGNQGHHDSIAFAFHASLSVVLCGSLCLCGERFLNYLHHRDTEDHGVTQSSLLLPELLPALARATHPNGPKT